MPLNSLDVQNKKFETKMRGYDKDAIDDFLDIVVQDYDEFSQKIKNQEIELKSLRERVQYFDEMKDSLNKSIVVAQDAADNLKSQAQNESGSIIAEASQKSQLIIESAKKEAETILNQASEDLHNVIHDSDELKRETRLYHQKLSGLFESQRANLASKDWEDLLKPSEVTRINSEEKLQEIMSKHESAPSTNVLEPGQTVEAPQNDTPLVEEAASEPNPVETEDVQSQVASEGTPDEATKLQVNFNVDSSAEEN
ncbi:MAG: DivIVA domain-containing protein [Streptococcaceae bacterium]|nr:DivIVA domain-containing protein [Streptococcaceae bacterium]